ncbi:anaerobic ribonucleoside-triphosphate reductase activating protein [Clostridium malenominatum]|uniref:Anaerobic ribonucleoside-triphosphate reductase-activating protein n=1 Tax=Clostridium malenominatum TaxID=1539 RepID=A0ABP3UAE8_9CLOT
MTKLQVAGFLDNSLSNGPGIRAVLFVAGCNHNCIGCHNKAMQDFGYGEEVPIVHILDRIKNNVPVIRGVTLSGGEPFEQAENLGKLARFIKNEGLDVWCYTGYTYEYIIDYLDKFKGWRDLLNNIDVLVDGKFEEDKASENLKYKGSSNQRIIDVKASILSQEVMLFENI